MEKKIRVVYLPPEALSPVSAVGLTPTKGAEKGVNGLSNGAVSCPSK